MKKRFTRTGCSTERNPGLLPIRSIIAEAFAPFALPEAGHNDANHFPRAEVVHLAISRDDLDTIAAALVAANVPEMLSLLHRLKCR